MDLDDAQEAPSDLRRWLFCPGCGKKYHTMRRWRMSCPFCGLQWEEANSGDLQETSTLAETLVFALLWGGLLAIVGFVVWMVISIASGVRGASPAVGVAVAAGAMMLFALRHPIVKKSSNYWRRDEVEEEISGSDTIRWTDGA